MISALLWDIKQRRVAVSYRRFGTTYWSLLQVSRSPRRMDCLTLEDGTVGCPETLVRNYHSTLRNILEDRRSQS